MSTLADYTCPALLVPALRSKTAPDAIAELCATLQRVGRLDDAAAFYDAVMAREKLSPTTFIAGWAVPHARFKGLTQLSFAFARCSRPIAWLGNNEASVQTVFLFAVPELETKSYLTLVASIARLSQNQSLLERLLQAQDPQVMFEVLGQVSLRKPSPASVPVTPARYSRPLSIRS